MSKLAFSMQTISMDLPSKGVLYSEDHPLANGVYTYHPMRGKEEDILLNQKLIKTGEALDALIISSTEGKKFDPNTLLVSDKNAILFAIRMSGPLGASYVPDGNLNCRYCDHSWEHTFDLREVSFQFLEFEPVKERTNLFSYILPNLGFTIYFKFLTGAEEKILGKEEGYTSQIQGVDVIENEKIISRRLALMIERIEGKDEKGNPLTVSDKIDIMDFVENAPATELRFLKEYINKIEPNIDLMYNIECPKCSEIGRYSLPIGINFFWSDIRI